MRRKKPARGQSRASAGSAILAGVRVLDLTRLAPGPYCTMLLADMGAEVLVIGGGRGGLPLAAFCRGKKFIRLNLKAPAGIEAFRRLARTADVVIEGFRPGVCERLGIGYRAMRRENPQLVYCSLTGYGADGPLAQEAGHDINYLGLSGALGAFGPHSEVPTAPLNIIADFAAGGLLAAFGVVSALYERERSGEGQHIDAAMVDGCISMMAMHYMDWGKPTLPSRGRGLLAGEAPFYRCYACADGRHVAVGALERAFFVNLWTGLGFEAGPPDHMDRSIWADMTKRFVAEFRRRPRDAWVEHFLGEDACVSPVLAPDEVFRNEQVRSRFPDASAENVPAAPRFTRSRVAPARRDPADRSIEVLHDLGLTDAQIKEAVPPDEAAAIEGLIWPPLG